MECKISDCDRSFDVWKFLKVNRDFHAKFNVPDLVHLSYNLCFKLEFVIRLSEVVANNIVNNSENFISCSVVSAKLQC